MDLIGDRQRAECGTAKFCSGKKVPLSQIASVFSQNEKPDTQQVFLPALNICKRIALREKNHGMIIGTYRWIAQKRTGGNHK
jgi:hypothetical protein